LKLCITMLIHNKDNIKLLTEFPCSLGHPVLLSVASIRRKLLKKLQHTSQIVKKSIYNIKQIIEILKPVAIIYYLLFFIIIFHVI